MDVAHVATGPLTPEEKDLILEFTRRAISNVCDLLKQVMELVKSRRIELDPTPESLDKDKRKLLRTLRKYLGK